MCGILGARIIATKNELIFCTRLMEELVIRGTHSYGICFNHKNKYTTIKSLLPKFYKFLNKFDMINENGFIFHNRYSTSGDWNFMENNQPITVNNIGSIAMNGVLSMATKEEYEKKYNVKCESDNDAEIFLRKIEQGIEIEEFLIQEKECSFAGIFLMGDEIFGIRNNKRPLYYYESNNGKYITSTLDTIRRAGGNWRNSKMIKPFERCYI